MAVERIEQFGETVWVEDTTDAIKAIYLSAERGEVELRMFVVGKRGEWLKWAVFTCPCGEGKPILINLREGQSPNVWGFEEHEDGTITLSPSVLLGGACTSHFFIRRNRVDWC